MFVDEAQYLGLCALYWLLLPIYRSYLQIKELFLNNAIDFFKKNAEICYKKSKLTIIFSMPARKKENTKFQM
jgi:hypothetical protein